MGTTFTIHYSDDCAPETIAADYARFGGVSLDVYRWQGSSVVLVAIGTTCRP